LAIEYRWAEGHNDRLSAFATDLVRRQVAVIVTAGTPLGFKDFRDSGVKRTSGLAQQGAVGSILHKGVLEKITCMRRRCPPKQQTCLT
jgi:hypothetical protein